MFDVARVRGLYISLGDGWTYLNAHQRAQMPATVSTAAATGFRISSLCADVELGEGSHSKPTEVGATRGEEFHAAARRAVADLVGSRPGCVVLGPSKAQLIATLSQALSHRIGLGTEMILSRADDAATSSAWLRAGRLYGAKVNWAEAELSSGEVPAWQYQSLVNDRTALVSVPAAHHLVGSINDVTQSNEIIHMQSRALTVVDVTSIAPYRPIDIHALGADIVMVDLAPLGGPDLGALVVRDPRTFSLMHNMSSDPDAQDAEKLMIGSPQYGLESAVSATIDHWSHLDDAVMGTRRRRLVSTLPKVDTFLGALAMHAIHGLQDMGSVHVVGVDGDAEDATERIPRISFLMPHVQSAAIATRLASNGVVAGLTRPGSDPLFKAMGVDEAGGAITIGLAPFNTAYDVDQLLRAVASLT